MATFRSLFDSTPFFITPRAGQRAERRARRAARALGIACCLSTARARRISYQRSAPSSAPSATLKSTAPSSVFMTSSSRAAGARELDVRAALAGDAVGFEQILEQRREVDAAHVLIERHARDVAGRIDADVAAVLAAVHRGL